MNCRYSKLTPLLTTDSSVESVDQTIETDFYDPTLMNDNTDLTEDNTDLNNEKLLLQTDLYHSNNYFGTQQLRGLPSIVSLLLNKLIDKIISQNKIKY